MAVSEKRLLAAANARAVQRATGRYGGRPKGVLNKATIAKIQSGEAFVKATTKKLGQVADDLLRNSKYGDTGASKELLDRTIGPVRKDVHLTGEFALRALHVHALPKQEGQVDAPHDTIDTAGAPTVVPLVES